MEGYEIQFSGSIRGSIGGDALDEEILETTEEQIREAVESLEYGDSNELLINLLSSLMLGSVNRIGSLKE